MDSVFLQNDRHSLYLVLFKSLLYDLFLKLRSCQQVSILFDQARISLCLMLSGVSHGGLRIVLEK